MINILIHGLVQNETSWNKVKTKLNSYGIDAETPNLFDIAKNYQLNYENLYKTFADYCNNFKQKINLIGLSLGGILAIDYAAEYPEKVNSIILIGAPYEIPRNLFIMQCIIYKCMPKKVFEQIGCPKKDLICLLNSMRNLTIPKKAKNIGVAGKAYCPATPTKNLINTPLHKRPVVWPYRARHRGRHPADRCTPPHPCGG